jgi:hypothetical protein
MDRPYASSIKYLPSGDVHLTFEATVKSGVAHKVVGMLASNKLLPEKKSRGQPTTKAAKRTTKKSS